MRAALVTGATSHVGNALVRALIADGVPTRAVVSPGESLTALDGLPVDIVEVDSTDFARLVPTMIGAEVVFHADLTGDVKLTRALVAATKEAGVRRLMYLAPMAALSKPRGEWLDEMVGLHCDACRLVEEAAIHGEVDAVVVLMSNVIGPWDFSLSGAGQLIAAVGRGALPFVVAGSREWVDVRDAVRGILAAAESGRCAETYLLSGGSLEVEQVCALVAKDAGGRAPLQVPGFLEWVTQKVHPDACAPGNCYRASTMKASQELGFEARPLERSVVDTWVWLMTHPMSPMRRQLALQPQRRALRATI